MEKIHNSNTHLLCKTKKVQLWLIKTTGFTLFLPEINPVMGKIINSNFVLRICHLLNFEKRKRLMITLVTNKVIIKIRWNIQTVNKENMKYIKFSHFSTTVLIIKMRSKSLPKIRGKAKGTRWNWNIKSNFMARYCHNCTFLEEVSFEQYEEFQISRGRWVQFFEPVRNFFLSILK